MAVLLHVHKAGADGIYSMEKNYAGFQLESLNHFKLQKCYPCLYIMQRSSGRAGCPSGCHHKLFGAFYESWQTKMLEIN